MDKENPTSLFDIKLEDRVTGENLEKFFDLVNVSPNFTLGVQALLS